MEATDVSFKDRTRSQRQYFCQSERKFDYQNTSIREDIAVWTRLQRFQLSFVTIVINISFDCVGRIVFVTEITIVITIGMFSIFDIARCPRW